MKAFRADKKTFVFKKADTEVARLTYDKGWSEKAGISLSNGNQYRIKSLGFWKSGFEVMQDNKVVAKIHTKWTGNISLEMFQTTNKAVFILSRKGIWKERHELADKDRFVLATVVSRFRWKTFSTDYEFSLSHRFERNEQHELLLVLMLFILRSMMSHNAHVMIPA
jgi:hypothetical protein